MCRMKGLKHDNIPSLSFLYTPSFFAILFFSLLYSQRIIIGLKVFVTFSISLYLICRNFSVFYVFMTIGYK